MNTLEPTLVFPLRWRALFVLAATTIVFDVFFWDRGLGLNLFLFVLLMGALLMQRYSFSSFSRAAWIALGGVVIAGLMVFVHNSALSIVVSLLALVIASASIQESRLRSLFCMMMHSIANFIVVPFKVFSNVDGFAPTNGISRKLWRWFKVGVLPLLILLLFTQLYRAGNPRFDHLTSGFMDHFWKVVSDALSQLFTAHTFFLLFGLTACIGLLHRLAPSAVVKMEEQWSDALVRTRLRSPHWAAPSSMDGLERERRMGVFLLLLVNALLVVVNAIDIHWLWFGFEVPVDFSLKQFVHDGTWMLIISILLSMIILMYLFRKNLNFHSRNQGLKTLALLWIGQNLVLGISVFLRNYHYIAFHGLAYKRIGVIVFLGLVLVGLVTLYSKVRRTKSLFYLARVNGWAAFVVLVALTTVDWDSVITRYNLGHWNQGEIDVDNYLTMSDKVLPLLYANLDVVEAQMAQHRFNTVRWVDHLDPPTFRMELDAKRDRFLQRYAEQDWQEMNLADQRTAGSLAPIEDAP